MNLQGLFLTVVGLVVFLIGGVMMVFASKKKTVSRSLWKNEQVNYFQRPPSGQEPTPQNPRYMFSLQYPSLVKGVKIALKDNYLWSHLSIGQVRELISFTSMSLGSMSSYDWSYGEKLLICED